MTSRLRAVHTVVLVVTFISGLVASGAGAQTPAPVLVRVGSVPLATPPTALAAAADRLLVGSGAEVRVFDVSRPGAPETTGAYAFDEAVLGLAAAGDRVYVANSHDGLRRLDLSDPSAPILTGTSATRGQAVGVAVAETRVFVSDNSLGFDIVAAAGGLRRVGEYLSDGFPRGIAAAGALVLVADQPAGLMVIDVSTPGAPEVIGRLSLGRDPVTQVIAPAASSAGGEPGALVAIVSGRRGLQAVDLSDPTAPAVTAAVPTVGRLAGAAMWGRRIHAASEGVLQVFDLTDPRRPVLAGAFPLGAPAGPVAVSEALVFAATPDEVVIFRRQ